MVKAPERAVKILLVEDSPGDIFLVKNLLVKCPFPIQLRVVRDGEEALNTLHQSSSFPGKEDPDFILLDLKLPKLDGHMVLSAIKGDSGLRHIPVLILTGSSSEEDRALARENKADDYLVKASGVVELESLSKRLENFWNKIKGKKA